MAAVTSAVAAGVGAVSAVAGAVKGARGTPGISATQALGKKSAMQKGLETDSLNSYREQQALAQSFEQGIAEADAMRDPAIQAYLQQINGTAFQATPQELAQIQTIRDAMVQQGTQGINQFVNEGLTQATSGAAARGLRGQALGALRGDVINNATNQVGGIQNAANLFAAQQAMSQPYQRVQAQQNALQQGLSYGDQMRLQAQQNRQQLQSPFLLSMEQAGRSQRTSTPGQPGGFWGGVTGAATGLSAGLGTASNTLGSLRDLGIMGGGSGGGSGGYGYEGQ